MSLTSAPSWLVTGVAASATLVGAVVLRYLLSTRRPEGYPPGPPTFLGLGNLHQIPLEQPFLQFHEWSKAYGDIIGLKVGPSNLVILHSPEYVRDLLDRRGAIYSGRPYSYIPAEHILGEHRDKHVISVQYGGYLRRWRSTVAYLVGPSGLKQTLPMQEATADKLVHKLLETPSENLNHIKHWALATPLLAITGQNLEDRGSDFANRFFNAQDKWLKLLEPGNAPPVDLFPFLRWVPEVFADWKTKARYIQDYMLEEYRGYFQTAKALRSREIDTTAFRSLMTKIIEDRDEEKESSPLSDDEIAYMGGGLLDAAVDTTWATIMTFILFMAAYPDIQVKVQEEIIGVSPHHLPDGDIIDELHYLRACLLEVFRLRPPAPNGLPHVLDRDDTFQGYTIPKGTTVLANVWGIQRREEDYDEPEKFMPERYLANPAGLKDGVDTRGGRRPTYTFGAGRRICPGEKFAENSVLIAMAKLLWTFDVVPLEALDTTVETGFHTGLVLSPKSFKVDFVPRTKTS